MEAMVDFERLFAASPEILLVLLPDPPRYTMVAATDARLAVTHSTRAQIIGRGLFDVFPDNPDDPGASGARNLRASLDRVLATRAPDTMAVQKYDIRGPDGTFLVKYWSPKNIPILSEAGEVTYVLHRVEDVSDLVRASEAGEELRGRTRDMEREVVRRSQELAEANQQLREAYAKLGQLDAAKTAFFSNVSHEFRTPLTLMLGPLEDALADAGEPLGARQRARVEMAHDHALRLLKLVNALLDFSRLEAGRHRADFTPVDLGPLTAELANMFESAASKAGIELRVDCPSPSERVLVDRDMWEKIVPNLVSNALKFTHAGHVAVRIREEPTRVVLEVADTGIGIPEVDLPRVFERFHRAAAAAGRTYEGTGIGLSLVRELVALHGGEVTVESVVGRGTTFRVAIPKGGAEAVVAAAVSRPIGRDARAHAVEAARWSGGRTGVAAALVTSEAPAASRAPLAPVASLAPLEAAPPRRARVLVVDDNADLRRYIADVLAPHFDVTTADDGLTGVQAARAALPDLVVSDVMMPRLDGFGLVRALRDDPQTAALPVILVSARAGEEAAVEGLDAGADDYVVKPFSAVELLARVRTHVVLSGARRAWSDQLEHANATLRREQKARRELTSLVVHDLKSPLAGILANAELLRAEAALDPEHRAMAEDIRTAAEVLHGMVLDILDVSMSEDGALVPRLDRVDVATLLHEAVHAMKPRAAGRGQTIVATVAPGTGALLADADLVRRVLQNLLDNCVKYGADAGTIEVDARPSGEGVVVVVADDGPGVPEEYRERIFERYSQVERNATVHNRGSRGLGLRFCRLAVEAHAGRTWVEARAPRGTRFLVWLPRAGAARVSQNPGT